MSDTLLRLGVRHWDHLVPLSLGDVADLPFQLDVARLDATPDLLQDARYDAAETSLSRYVRARAAGDDRLVGLPAFVMRGFRQRCFITRADSPLEDLAQLGGARIGLTGWPDSGNTWSRALVRRAGVALEDVTWFAGPLTAQHPVVDRIGMAEAPPNVSHTPGDRPMVDLLLAGELDAVMTPFMPAGFHDPDSPLRHLLRDYRSAEISYYGEVGYVPGIHLVTVRRESVAARPGLPAELTRSLEASTRAWTRQRVKLADTTPWLLAEIETTAATTGLDWMPYGVAANAAMVEDFVDEMHAQGLLSTRPALEDLFSEYLAVEEAA